MAQPKSKAQEAYEYLQSYAGLTNPNSLKFHSWLRDAENLMSVDAAEGYILKGFAHMALGNPDLAVQSFRAGHQLKDDLATHNYAVALYKVGEFTQSHELCLNILRKNPHDGVILSVAISNIGRMLDLDKWHEVRALIGDISIKEENTIVEYIHNTLSDIEQVNISKEIFVYINHLINKFLAKRYLGKSYSNNNISQTEIGNILSTDFYLNNVGIDDCLRFNDEFLDVLIADKTLHYDDYKNLLVHFIPTQYDNLGRAL